MGYTKPDAKGKDFQGKASHFHTFFFSRSVRFLQSVPLALTEAASDSISELSFSSSLSSLLRIFSRCRDC